MYTDTRRFYSVDYNISLVKYDFPGCISDDSIRSIIKHCHDQIDYAQKHGESHWSIFLGEVADSVPNLDSYINTEMSEDDANEWLDAIAKVVHALLKEFFQISFPIVDVIYWERGYDDEEFDIYDGPYVSFELRTGKEGVK